MRTLDDLITLQLSAQKLTGLALAVVDDGKIAKEKGYGVTESNASQPVTSAANNDSGAFQNLVKIIAKEYRW